MWIKSIDFAEKHWDVDAFYGMMYAMPTKKNLPEGRFSDVRELIANAATEGNCRILAVESLPGQYD